MKDGINFINIRERLRVLVGFVRGSIDVVAYV